MKHLSRQQKTILWRGAILAPLLVSVWTRLSSGIVLSELKIYADLALIICVALPIPWLAEHRPEIYIKKIRPISGLIFFLSLGSLLLLIAGRGNITYITEASYLLNPWRAQINALALASLYALFAKQTGQADEETGHLSRGRVLLIGLLLIAGLAIRLHRLGDLSLWWDENYTGTQVRNILEYGWPRSPESALFYWRGLAYHYLLAIFAKLGTWNEFWLRFPGVLMDISSIIISVWLATRIDRKLALPLAVLLIFSPYHIETSRFARFYIMNSALFMTAIVVAEKGFFQNKAAYKLLFLALALLMVHSVQLGAFFIFILLAYFISDWLRDYQWSSYIKRNISNLPYALAALAIAYGGNLFERFFQKDVVYLYQNTENVIPPARWEYLSWPKFDSIIFFDHYFSPIFFVLCAIVLVWHHPRHQLAKFVSLIFAMSLLAYEIIGRGVMGGRIFFLWSYLASLLFIFGLSMLLKILSIKHRELFMTIFICLLLLTIKPYAWQIVNLNHGDDVSNNPFRSTSVAAYRPDNRSHIEYFSNFRQAGDIWIATAESSPYVRSMPDFLFSQNYRWNTSAIGIGDNYYVNANGSKLISRVSDIEIIKSANPGKRVWITVNGSSLKILETTHFRQDFLDFLKDNEKNTVYRSPDGLSSVLLFE